MKAIDNKFKFSIMPDAEFEREGNTTEIWWESKNVEGRYLIRYIRPFRVQKVLNTNLHLN